MREIKFRAWDTSGKFMFDSFWVGSRSGNLYDKRDMTDTLIELPDQDQFVLMQFTGLKDKNCKEIYEGDILGCQLGNVEVKWHRQGWLPFIAEKGSAFEVIGNIYENPELLDSHNQK